MRPSAHHVRARLLAGTLLIAALAGGLLLAARSEAGDERGPATARSVDQPVRADELWREGLRTLACFEQHGVPTVGPYPAADGAGINYSIVLGPAAEEAQRVCTAEYEPLARRFALDNEPPGGRGRAPRSDRAEVDRLLAIRAGMVRCLDLPGSAASEVDAALAAAAHERTDEVRACAHRAG